MIYFKLLMILLCSHIFIFVTSVFYSLAKSFVNDEPMLFRSTILDFLLTKVFKMKMRIDHISRYDEYKIKVNDHDIYGLFMLLYSIGGALACFLLPIVIIFWKLFLPLFVVLTVLIYYLFKLRDIKRKEKGEYEERDKDVLGKRF